MSKGNLTKVLIVEDSPTMLEVLRYIVESDKRFKVVGTVSDGMKVISSVKILKPDVILMDNYLPGMDGISITKQIMSTKPLPIIIVSSFISDNERSLAVKALATGAIAALEKPPLKQSDVFEKKAAEIIKYLAFSKDIRLVTRKKSTPQKPSITIPQEELSRNIQMIVIGASTGGPQTLTGILKMLPADFPIPIAVVQHISPNFVRFFVEQLNEDCRLNVMIANDGEVARPGHIYLAPGNYHLCFKHSRFCLNDDAPHLSIKPSVDYLFHSAAENFKQNVMAILLTGMGKDGAEGLKKIKETGGITIAQNEESCVVFGMPGEAIKMGAVEHIMDPLKISNFLIRLQRGDSK